MSRSSRRRAYASCHGSSSQKPWKQIANRAMRRSSRRIAWKDAELRDHTYNNTIYPVVDEVMNVWNMPQDGKKRYFPFRNHPFGYLWWYKQVMAK